MPMNMMQSILDKTGLGGFRTGISDRDQLMHSNVDLTTKNIANNRSQNFYENELLDNPLKAVERAQKIAAGESDTADILAGGRDKDRQQARDKLAAELAGKLDENARKKIEDTANATVRAASIFKDDDTPLLREQKWSTAAAILRESGQENVPDRYDPTAYEKLMQRAKAAPMTLQQIQSIQTAENKAKHESALSAQNYGQSVGLAQMNNIASQQRQDSQNETTLEATRIRDRGEWGRHNQNPVLSKSKEVVAAKSRVDAAIKGEGKASLLDFESVAANDYGPAVKRNTDILKIDAEKRIESLNQQIRMNEGNSKKVAEYEAQIEKIANKLREDIEKTSFPAAFRKKYDEIRKQEYGSVDDAPVPAVVEHAMTTPPATSGSTKALNFDEWKVNRDAEDARVAKVKGTPEYLALSSEYDAALASRNQTEARSIKAEMNKLLGVAPKSTPAPAPAAKASSQTPPPGAKGKKLGPDGRVTHWQMADGSIVPAK